MKVTEKILKILKKRLDKLSWITDIVIVMKKENTKTRINALREHLTILSFFHYSRRAVIILLKNPLAVRVITACYCVRCNFLSIFKITAYTVIALCHRMAQR